MTSRDSDVIDALAWDVVAFMRDVDQFSYDDAFDSFEDGVEQTRTLLAGGISRSDVTDTIRSLIDDDALLPEQEVVAWDLLARIALLDGAKPSRNRRASARKKPSGMKRWNPQGYSAIIIRSNGDYAFTAIYDLDTLRFVVIPDALRQEPGAKLFKIVTEAEKEAILAAFRAKGVQFK